jgi:FtsZ-binding cell division protein ZapB
MDDQFAKLEAKVAVAIELIKDLRSENARLQVQCRDLEHQVVELTDAGARRQHALAEARDATAQVKQFEAKRRLIEERVGGLLDKLEAMG